MRPYVLTQDAEKDLRDIIRYTLRQWGKAQVISYQDALNNTLDAIGNGQVVSRPVSLDFPQVRVVRCQKHFVFYLEEGRLVPVIFAIIHEKRDVVRHLSKRLKDL